MLIIKPVPSQQTHATPPFQAFGHAPADIRWRVTNRTA